MNTNVKSDPLYAVGYEHGLTGMTVNVVGGDAYSLGFKAGSEAREIFSSAGFSPIGKGSFEVNIALLSTVKD